MNIKVHWSGAMAGLFTARFHGLLRSYHSLCRSSTGQQRFQDKKRGEFLTMNVKVPWSVPWPSYSPPDFSAAAPPLDSKDFWMKREGSS
jgi:hypothetical protein